MAAIEEAIQLRESGITLPILLLEGWFEARELAQIQHYQLWTALHSAWQVDEIEAAEISAPLSVWVKIDSGMHRLGLHPDEFPAVAQRLSASPKIAKLVAMTHFARADELDSQATPQQIGRFQQAVAGLGLETSLSNSGGILACVMRCRRSKTPR